MGWKISLYKPRESFVKILVQQLELNKLRVQEDVV